jgi:hypothetical protein
MKRSVHPGSRFRALQSPEELIKLSAEDVELEFRSVLEDVELVHRDQDRFGSVVLGDDDGLALDCFLQKPAKFVLGLSRRK